MALYPFCRLSGPANVLVMPALHSAHISSNLLEELEVGSMIGPILVGLEKPVQIVSMKATVADIINLAAIGSIDAIEQKGVTGGSLPRTRTAKPKLKRAAAKNGSTLVLKGKKKAKRSGNSQPALPRPIGKP